MTTLRLCRFNRAENRQPGGRVPSAAVCARLLIALLASLALVTLACGQERQKVREAESELKAVQSEIERIQRQISRDQIERDRLARDLRQAEMSVAAARRALEELQQERAERTARRAVLARERREREAQLTRERTALAAQLRAAYLIGREEPLKLLLNQKDPARAGRMFTYYGYFGRARAEQIARIEEGVQHLERLDRELEAEETRLAELEAARRAELARIEEARAQRKLVLARVQEESRSRTESLARLKSQQEAIEKLLRELRRAMQKFPVDSQDAFSKLRGRLAWPVSGKVAARFGQTRAGGLRWEGVLLETERGTPVRAVYHGRVIYADWLPGLGLLTIVDHGEGYLSLYGHNDRLYKAAGERVRAGDTIAAAGDSGGRSRPELYFEVRKDGRPVDPRPWFRSPQPE